MSVLSFVSGVVFCEMVSSGFYFKVRFGALYALFVGEDRGQGGSEFELEHVFANKRLALQHVSEKPMVALEIK